MADWSDTYTSLSGLGNERGTAVTAAVSGVCTVNLSGTVVTVMVARDLTVSAGDVVLVAREGSSRWVIARLYAAAPVPAKPNEGQTDPSPDPKPTTVTGALVVSPVETRSYRDGRWRTDTDDTLQGVYPGYGNNIGCAFFGDAPKSLAGSTVQWADIRVKRTQAGVFAAQTSELHLLADAFRPGGTVTMIDTATGPTAAVGEEVVFNIPTGWAQQMVDSTAGGIAIYNGGGAPYMRFAGINSWGPAWTLGIGWSRTV